jgi:hypothetical protein
VRRIIGVPRTYLKLAAAVLAAGVAVAACSTVKMGAAAIVGNQRISAAQLGAEVATYNTEYNSVHSKNPQIQQQFPASQTPQQVLGWLVSFQVADRMAQRNGITVTPALQNQAQRQVMTSVRQQNPGVALSATDLAAAFGLAPDMMSGFWRLQAIQGALVQRLQGRTPPTTQAAEAALESKFAASQCRAAKSLTVQVNPQFGQLDYNLNEFLAYSVVAAPTTLSKSSVPTPSSTASPLLTPPC